MRSAVPCRSEGPATNVKASLALLHKQQCYTKAYIQCIPAEAAAAVVVVGMSADSQVEVTLHLVIQ
jgi:hypothetical protein